MRVKIILLKAERSIQLYSFLKKDTKTSTPTKIQSFALAFLYEYYIRETKPILKMQPIF